MENLDSFEWFDQKVVNLKNRELVIINKSPGEKVRFLLSSVESSGDSGIFVQPLL